MSKKTVLMSDVSEWGLSLRLTLTTTEQVDLECLGKMDGVKVSAGEGGALRYDIPADDLTPERPCNTTLMVTTHTDGETQEISRTDIEIDPNNFYYKGDPVLFLCRILKIDPDSLKASEVHISDGENSSTLELPNLNDSLFDFPNGFLLEKST